MRRALFRVAQGALQSLRSVLDAEVDPSKDCRRIRRDTAGPKPGIHRGLSLNPPTRQIAAVIGAGESSVEPRSMHDEAELDDRTSDKDYAEASPGRQRYRLGEKPLTEDHTDDRKKRHVCG